MTTASTPPWAHWERRPGSMAALALTTGGLFALWWLVIALTETREFNRGDGAGPMGCGSWTIVALAVHPLILVVPFLFLARDIRTGFRRTSLPPDGFPLVWPLLLAVTPTATWVALRVDPSALGLRPALQAAGLGTGGLLFGVLVLSVALFVYRAQLALNHLWRSAHAFATPLVPADVDLPTTRRITDPSAAATWTDPVATRPPVSSSTRGSV